jgi:ribosomal protein S18 acetylase RimI-like enzyme
MFAMLWNAPAPPEGRDFTSIRLGPEHIEQMVAMAALTRPGPFADRPLDVGEWHGVMEGDRLVAMAGERLHHGSFREVSGVCTLPECRGRGYAKRLMETVVRSQLARGLQPFLHVASTNTGVRTLYERMGFAVVREVPMRVVSRSA